MDAVVAVSIGILTVVLLASAVGLAFVIRVKICGKKEEQDGTELIEQDLQRETRAPDDLELTEFGISDDDIERIAENVRWVDDINGWIPQCLTILRTGHQLTEKLITATLSRVDCKRHPEKLEDLLRVTRTIGPLIDDIARSMEPPLDPRLLEARCVALVVSVEYLALVSQAAIATTKEIPGTGKIISDLRNHLAMFRQAAKEAEQNSLQIRQNAFRSSLRSGRNSDYVLEIPAITLSAASPV